MMSAITRDVLRKNSNRIFVVAVILIGVIAVIFSGWISSLWEGQEDAFITYSYAKHLASGQGFVFSYHARPSLGTTTPLYTLILALFACLGLPPHIASIWIGVLCHGFIAVLLVMLAAKFMGRWLSLAAGMYWSLALSIFFRLGGMETAFLILLLVCLAVSEMRMQASPLSALLLGLLLLCRPDSLLILAIFFALWTLSPKTRNYTFRNALIIAFITLPWILYAAYTFGSIIPSSLIAKLVSGESGIINLNSFSVEYFPFLILVPLIVGICILGTTAIWRDHAGFRAFLLWIPSYYLCFRVGNAPDFAWYYVPPLVFVPILLNSGLLSIASRMPAKQRSLTLVFGVVLSTLLWLNANLITTEGLRSTPQAEAVHKQLALFIRSKAGESDLTAAKEVGMLSYYSERPVLDLLGLTSPEVLQWSRVRDFEGIIRHYKPRFLMLFGVNGTALGYREIHRVPYWAGDYIIWKRIQK